MSHTLADDIKAEPNLIPLLDLVFQLIMFFMICVNFVSAQVNEEIKLPIAQSARAMDKAEFEVLVLNMEASGKLLVVGQPEPLDTVGKKKYFLKQFFADAKRAAEESGDKKGQVKTTIIIRADRNAIYEEVFELMALCKEAGFKKLQLRAFTRAGG
ncbi:MAG TPA: biopolymer transporter ExbD [Gemmataceae bacterium]|jgi:biopolymer transport protein ExbD|nr:biopolymer transporter ExbD [Gemmataceae bacterium]